MTNLEQKYKLVVSNVLSLRSEKRQLEDQNLELREALEALRERTMIFMASTEMTKIDTYILSQVSKALKTPKQ